MGVNYGGNKVRFLTPVRSGSRVRGRFTLLAFDEKRPGQFQQTTNGARETCGDTAEDQDRNPVAQTTLGNLLTQPHQEHRAGRQADHGGHAETKTRADHQTGCAFQGDRDTE